MKILYKQYEFPQNYYILYHILARVTPFKLGVHFDDHEAVGVAAMAGMIGKADMIEASAGAAANDSPLGVIGFSLGFAQLGCA